MYPFRFCQVLYFLLRWVFKGRAVDLLPLIFLTISDFKLELSDNFQIICYLCLYVKSTILLFVLHSSHLFFFPPSFSAFFGPSIFIPFYFHYKFLSYISCFIFYFFGCSMVTIYIVNVLHPTLKQHFPSSHIIKSLSI